MFMTSVLWSDNTEVIIYRSFQEFRKCHVSPQKLKKSHMFLDWCLFCRTNKCFFFFQTDAAEEEIPYHEHFQEKWQSYPHI